MAYSNKKFTPIQAYNKIQYYCSYQERSHFEVKEKLYGYGLNKLEVETIIIQLIEENFLNEERFAIQFAGGKFRQKKWGKNKIVYELKNKRVSSRNIQIGINSIDSLQYQNTLHKLALQKWNSLKKDSIIAKKVKTTKYLLQKGFEQSLIKEAIVKICLPDNIN
ncbi:MAG TPA: regulatory protein RecX [Chitinophagaceae bacterium]|nr:RecX family transcriptional regulator [Chitinophagaceae bacterium]MCC6634912.1 RecX family transcriptional regulator [Chitinophagaceae bacterium]HMZ46168.1 regulatory protein RecX [Chitinophagaceae bacterium]HNE93520.1 regulatory protein RecX [Chitinophagaceae bacterium]HNJ58884.1 regulatory protein RecX [Chitinophagaceae bacterium]